MIAASSGMRGDSEKEKALTEARSFVVRKYLVEHFKLADTRVKTLGRGKIEGVNSDGTVELLVFGDAATLSASEPKSKK